MTGSVNRILGIDGGGSGCRVRLEDRAGRVLASARGGPANVSSDFEAARANLLEAIAATYEAAGLDMAARGDDVAWAGLAGAGEAALAARMARALGFARARVSSDCATTLEGALAGGDGVVALLGTGSFFLRRAGDEERRIGGWGYQLGDEAGGAWLGREALSRVLWAADGLIAESGLTRDLLARFGGPAGVVRFAQAAAPGDIAALAPDITAAARAGDPVADEIVGQAVGLIEQRLAALGARDLGVVVLAGGLAAFYRERLAGRWGDLLRPPAGSALDGALALARRHLMQPTETAR